MKLVREEGKLSFMLKRICSNREMWLSNRVFFLSKTRDLPLTGRLFYAPYS